MKILDNTLRALAILLIISTIISLFTAVRDGYVLLQYLTLWGILQGRNYLPYLSQKKEIPWETRDGCIDSECTNPNCPNPNCPNQLIYGYKPIEVYPEEIKKYG